MNSKIWQDDPEEPEPEIPGPEPPMFDLASRMGGIVLKKAEIEENFEAVYSRVFERLGIEVDFPSEEFLYLNILGEIGG